MKYFSFNLHLLKLPVVFFLLGTLSFFSVNSQVKSERFKVLVYTRNGKGYVHDNRAAAADMVKKLGKEKGFDVVVTDTPIIFTSPGFAEFRVLIFASTNNDVFDNDEQRLAFRKYIESGGGFVGIHSVMGTERNWTWFKNMMGGSFAWHPRNQVYTIQNIRPDHPSLKNVPLVWTKQDECYFSKELYPGPEVLMAHNITTLNKDQEEEILKNAGKYNVLYPAVWYHRYDGGHIWITTLGHDIANYSDPVFVNHLFQGISYIARLAKKKNASKPYATGINTPLKFSNE
ncbi:ThuA domain-containing protein [Pollutibacter soli]|uniref:ThuA domain-containing protein n=1 Tax=Pollutibacter soli TaxID=3034157 RepID=UPI0030140670